MKTQKNNRNNAKGQLISKCPYEKLVSSKIPTKIFLEFWPDRGQQSSKLLRQLSCQWNDLLGPEPSQGF